MLEEYKVKVERLGTLLEVGVFDTNFFFDDLEGL